MNKILDLELIEKEVYDLINLKTEGDYWDFKLEWPDKSSLLIDIIAMANNLANRDAYIIIGVEDQTGIIHGRKDCDANYKNQQQLVNFLRHKKFAGGVRPTVYLHTIEKDKIDVIIIPNSTNTPFYLEKTTLGLSRGSIYTRIVDNNTPRNEIADVDKVEYLWKKRFGIDNIPFEKVKTLLKNPKDWYPMATDGKHSTNLEEYKNVWYNINFPEYTISYEPRHYGSLSNNHIDKIDMNFYWIAKLNPGGSDYSAVHVGRYSTLKIRHSSSVIFAIPMISANSFSFKRVQWKTNIISNPDKSKQGFTYGYIEKDSIEYLIDNWLCASSETIPGVLNSTLFKSDDKDSNNFMNRNVYKVVLVFENGLEHKLFREYLANNKNLLFDEIDEFKKEEGSTVAQAFDPRYIEYLCNNNEILKDILDDWRDLAIKQV